MLTNKELLQLEDVLNYEQSSINTLNFLSSNTQDAQSKQLLQQLAQKNQQHFQNLNKHLSGQNLQ